MARRHKSETEYPPQPQGRISHTHIHEASRMTPIFAKAIVIVTFVVLIWPAGVFLLGRAGVHQPDRTWAQLLLWLLGLLFFGYLATLWFESVMDRWFDHQQTMANIETEQLRHKQMMLRSAVTDTRALGEEKRLNALILAIMMDAYDYLSKNNTRYFRGQSRPWSRRQAGAQVLASLGEREPVGEAMAQRARAWLEERGIVTGEDQVDLERYPNLASIQRLLYAPPLVRSPYLPSSGEDGPEWNIIENS